MPGVCAIGGPIRTPTMDQLAGWAVAFDTPFTSTKQVASDFGGARNGMVMHWPKGIQEKGGPTILEAAGLPQPTSVNGTVQTPIEGTCMLYAFNMVGFRQNTLAQPADRYFARVGITHTVTGLLRFDTPGDGTATPRIARLCFYLDNPTLAMAPDVKEYMLQEDPSSIRGLSPGNPLIQALAEIAIDRQVPFHTIIGDRGLGDGALGSDGVVPYTSAHLEGAESELIVPADHSAHVHPLAVLEVKRILKLYLHIGPKP